MPLSTQLPGLYYLDTESKGRSVFTSEDITEGSIIEICPVIIINPEETTTIHKTQLHDYYFIWDIETGSSAIALGYGSLYNHSDDPNSEFEVDRSNQTIRFVALKHILAGTELTVNYIAAKEEGVKLWFDPQ